MNIWQLCAALLLFAALAISHELDAAVTLSPPAVIVRAAYGGTEPVPFVKVQVFSPSSPAQEFQTGVTDKHGVFSFIPDGAGNWRVIVDDEEGHRREVTIPVPAKFASVTPTTTAPSSRLERVLLGLALLFGATGFLYGFKARRQS